MSEKVDNVYSFTTTEDDVYSMRVAEEATEDTYFIITTERNSLLNAHGHAIVIVRKSALEIALVAPELTLAGKTLIEWLEGVVEANGPSDWAAAVILGDKEAIDEQLKSVRHEIRRIKNVLEGKVVKVDVESF